MLWAFPVRESHDHRDHCVLQRCVGQLLLVHGGLPGGPPLVPDVSEKKVTLERLDFLSDDMQRIAPLCGADRLID